MFTLMEHDQKTILYVDDDADDREFLAEAIKGVNATVEVRFAENGLEALNLLDTIKNTPAELPCLIILDINMPYLDGRETFRRIRNHTQLQSIPIVVFTSSANPNDRALFNELGIEFITKPDNISYMNTIASRMINMCTC